MSVKNEQVWQRVISFSAVIISVSALYVSSKSSSADIESYRLLYRPYIGIIDSVKIKDNFRDSLTWRITLKNVGIIPAWVSIENYNINVSGVVKTIYLNPNINHDGLFLMPNETKSFDSTLCGSERNDISGFLYLSYKAIADIEKSRTYRYRVLLNCSNCRALGEQIMDTTTTMCPHGGGPHPPGNHIEMGKTVTEAN